MKALIRLSLILLQIFNSNCAHVSTRDYKTLDLTTPQRTLTTSQPPLEIKYLIYESSKFPLSEFFSRLKKGEYKESFRRVDFKYYSANTNSKILKDMIDSGFVPVYIQITNNTSVPIDFSESSFVLNSPSLTATPLTAKQVPREIQNFNPKALVANIYNTGVVILVCAIILGAVLVASKGGSVPNFNFPTSDSSKFSESSEPSESGEIYNDLQHTTQIDYQSLLISKTSLQPGEKAQGLLFWHIPDTSDIKEAKLLFLGTEPSSLQ